MDAFVEFTKDDKNGKAYIKKESVIALVSLGAITQIYLSEGTVLNVFADLEDVHTAIIA